MADERIRKPDNISPGHPPSRAVDAKPSQPPGGADVRGKKASPIPKFGALSLIAPFVGVIALVIFLRFVGELHPEASMLGEALYLLAGIRGPFWMVGWVQFIMGSSGLIGFILGCIALRRSENRLPAVLGLLLNGPMIFLFISALPALPALLDPATYPNREHKGMPAPADVR
jgi:hypothetical protein